MAAVHIVLLVDIAVPVAIAVALAVYNARDRTSLRSELLSWVITAAYVGLLAVLVFSGASSVNSTHGYGIVGAVIMALPASVGAAIVHVVLAYGLGVGLDPEMTAIFGVSLVCWTIVNPLGARRIRQAVRRRRSVTIGPIHSGRET